MITVYGLKQCSTTQKVIKFLENKGLTVEQQIDIREQPPAKDLILLALAETEGNPRKIINTSGGLYREMDVKNQLDHLSQEEIAALLADNGMLIKRPFITDGDKVSSGSKEAMLADIWL